MASAALRIDGALLLEGISGADAAPRIPKILGIH
jgi:hypothetical protein